MGSEDEVSRSVPRLGGVAASRFRTLNEITSPIVPTGTTGSALVWRKLDCLTLRPGRARLFAQGTGAIDPGQDHRQFVGNLHPGKCHARSLEKCPRRNPGHLVLRISSEERPRRVQDRASWVAASADTALYIEFARLIAPDIVLIGAGIMSATLGTMLKELDPSLSIVMLETLDDCAQESSEAWNNAGTGHAANCELNYTPQNPDGSVDNSRALVVNTEFDLSRQLWSYLVRKGAIADPRAFIHPCPHMSFVWGKENVDFLRARYKAMSAHHCYHGMDYSEDHKQTADWAPLIIEGRDANQPIAATRIVTGADVDYGSLTHLLVAHLAAQTGFSVHYKQRVVGLDREADGRWRVEIEDVEQRKTHTFPPNSSSSAPAVARCRCCKSHASPKPTATAAFRSVASGCAAT